KSSQRQSQKAEQDKNLTEHRTTQADKESRGENQKSNQESNQESNREQLRTASEAAHNTITEQALDAARTAAQLLAPAFLHRIPLGILVYRHDGPLYANRYFLDLSGYSDVAAIEAAGGLNRLFAEPGSNTAFAESSGAAAAIITQSGEPLP